MDLIHRFSSDVSHIKLPTRFNFPFYYVPHPLAVAAAKELQTFINTQEEWDHNFGLAGDSSSIPIGKMFGVLVIKDKNGELGYLRAFSGKLANSNHHKGFAPPVYDMLLQDGFYKTEENILNKYNRKIETKEENQLYIDHKKYVLELEEQSAKELTQEKQKVKSGKRERKAFRAEAMKTMLPSAYSDLQETLKVQSLKSNYFLRDLTKKWKQKLEKAREQLAVYEDEINNLKSERRKRSNALQEELFKKYTFLNSASENKSLLAIFRNDLGINPPAGAGECAAPKLLQFAFMNDYTPITLAEFWWGVAPNAEVRMSGLFYPACRGKCEPILGHMLSKTKMDPNPLLENPAKGKFIKVIYDDEDIAIISKPAEFLSVPGKHIADSVQMRVRSLYPEATGPMIVHRLDMSTSGIMLIAKNPAAYKQLQSQFIKRTITKTYCAVLAGQVSENEGLVDLPLRVDLNDRPRQLVCYEHGKAAQTRWKVLSRNEHTTRVHFFPITGRTHQLRVHAAHHKGLGVAIKGDDLYGQLADRLHLHAEKIIFEHPKTRKKFEISDLVPF